ncbi:peptidoglycan-binding protein [Streptomyces jumonjinensis]|uniref:Peptidoglycan-binding protein n=2 Tax=Streptomyces jumonjinensis TaxID=1945 RepID=A0A646KMI3_STRJU|nr:peptidoglycan-binding protein [Streptomyces jumonjinensis]
MAPHAPGETAKAAPGTLGTADGNEPGKDTALPVSRRRRRPLRTSLIVLAAVAVAAAAGLAATGALGGDSTEAPSSAPAGPPATATVKRTTLTDSETVDGNLGYGDATAVQAPPASSASSASSSASAQSGQSGQSTDSGESEGSNLVTWLPEEGKVIKRGETVYSVDQQKVPLLYGSFPFYRTLEEGSEGGDVKILEKNLSALGYTGFTVDDDYTSGTADAVEEWQDDMNREETGAVQPGDAVVASGARRIADVKTAPGAALSGSPLSWSGTERIISVDLDVQFEDLVKKGTKATVELPDDTTVDAVVTDIGTPSTSGSGDSADGSDGSGSGDSGDEATLPIELTVKNQKGLGRYQAAAVEVTLKAETRENVLTVPVNALVAQRGGGYAVEVVTAEGTEHRPVKLGMFADGMVEVSGKGIAEGTAVGVPK